MYLPNIPVHVVQHGNNRDACFFCEDENRYFLDRLREGRSRFGVALHAYVLMTPRDTAGISRLMQHLGRHYVLYINRQYRRTGTLWEGRHKASLVQADQYLLTCMRYVELNPVAAGMVQSPEQYRWSSYRWHARGEPNPLLRNHDSYVRLGANEHDRQCAYRELFRGQIPEIDVHDIPECLAYNHSLDNVRFREQVETTLGRRVGQRQRGRPPKRVDAPR
jgi:putative transposase